MDEKTRLLADVKNWVRESTERWSKAEKLLSDHQRKGDVAKRLSDVFYEHCENVLESGMWQGEHARLIGLALDLARGQ